MTQTILVTGGAGFIGSNFARFALERTSARLVVFDKLTYAGNLESLADLTPNPRFAFVRGDIASPSDLGAALATYAPTAIVNLAAETHVDRSIDAPRAFVATNVVGTFELLEAARTHYRSLAGEARAAFRFLQVSTDEVYGGLAARAPDEAFAETCAYAPSSPYAATKASADHLVGAYGATFGLPAITTNSSNNYGPYQYPEKLIPLVIRNALEGKPLPLYGDGGSVRDWLYVDDHCAAILLALERGRVGERYNVGGSNERTNVALVDAVCAALEERLPARENPALTARGVSSYAELKTFVPDRPGHDRRYAIDATKIRTELGWGARFDLAAGLARTVDWYVANRGWCEAVERGKYQRERLGLGSG